MTQGYCMKCKVSVGVDTLRDVKISETKNGSPAVDGRCPTCGSRVFTMIPKDVVRLFDEPAHNLTYEDVAAAAMAGLRAKRERDMEPFLREDDEDTTRPRWPDRR